MNWMDISWGINSFAKDLLPTFFLVCMYVCVILYVTKCKKISSCVYIILFLYYGSYISDEMHVSCVYMNVDHRKRFFLNQEDRMREIDKIINYIIDLITCFFGERDWLDVFKKVLL